MLFCMSSGKKRRAASTSAKQANPLKTITEELVPPSKSVMSFDNKTSSLRGESQVGLYCSWLSVYGLEVLNLRKVRA